MSRSSEELTTLDFQGVQCPYNYVKTKLYLEEVEVGTRVEVIVDAGEPERHVPKSLLADGQTIHETFTDKEGRVHLIVEKTAEYE